MALFTVNTLIDENDGVNVGAVSLRDAIAAANATAGPDIIEFDPGLNGTITLTNGDLVITESVTITGLGANILTIDADDLSRVFTIDDGDDDGADETVEISGLTLTGGNADDGGGIFNTEDLVLSDMVIRGNNATNDGGGVFNAAEARTRIFDSVIRGNDADDDGGGIANDDDGTLVLVRSRVSGNTAADDGGGIVNNGVLRARRSRINNNDAGEDGGGIDNDYDSVAILTNSTITNNFAGLFGYGGGVHNGYGSYLEINQSTIADNVADYGGGVFNSPLAIASITNSTISGNSADSYGGGIANDNAALLSVSNSTISGNTAAIGGGGVSNAAYAIAAIANTTISDNSTDGTGGGIDNGESAVIDLVNSLISGNTADEGNEIYNLASPYGPLYDGAIYADGNNLFGHSGEDNAAAFYNFAPGASAITATSDGTNSTDLADILEPLADNGGPTQTHALPDGSPAIDAGDNSNVPLDDDDQDGDGDFNEDVPFDQRGVAARVTNGTVDIGAYEECFLTGTRILTDKGEVAVETLQIGDLVQTAERTLEPIKWIGRQTREPQQVRNPLRSHPIHIKAGALGNGLPHRDLFVSPDHALLFEGLLINAGALVNGTSIVKTEPTETFTYFHVELDKHALLVAEGTAAESYLPQKEDRLVYDNGAEYEALYPHGSKIILWPLDYPRISSAVTVPRYIRKQLNQIAAELGFGEKAA